MTDLSMRGSIYASSSNCEDDDKTPNKLVKRKSLGFVQLGKGLVPNGGSTSGFPDKGKMRDRELDRESSVDVNKSSSKRPMSMQGHRLPSTMRQAATQRHASYGTPKKNNPDVSTDDLREVTRERKQSTPKAVRSKVRDPPRDKGKERERDEGKENMRDEEKKEEGGRGFMRRLSLVGRHRRTKSGASLTGIEPMARVPSESSTTEPPIPPTESTSEKPPSLPPLPPFSEIKLSRPRTPRTPGSSLPTLLPPIELQPPSPPRNTNTGPADTLVHPGYDSMLSPLSPTSSVQPPITSTSASASSASFPLYPKSPESTRSAMSPKTPKSPVSPYTASLGRSTISPKHSSVMVDGALRRNSLSDLKSDLKIPARISQAQQGLKRDLGMVRDFAVYIERACL